STAGVYVMNVEGSSGANIKKRTGKLASELMDVLRIQVHEITRTHGRGGAVFHLDLGTAGDHHEPLERRVPVPRYHAAGLALQQENGVSFRRIALLHRAHETLRNAWEVDELAGGVRHVSGLIRILSGYGYRGKEKQSENTVSCAMHAHLLWLTKRDLNRAASITSTAACL